RRDSRGGRAHGRGVQGVGVRSLPRGQAGPPHSRRAVTLALQGQVAVGALLGETFRILGSHLYLFSLLSLTVWLPGHVVRHYLEFFGSSEESNAQSLRLVLAMQVVFEPLVVSSVLCALARIKRSQPLGYLIVLTEGMAAWGRLFVVRFIVNSALAAMVL